MNEGSTIGIDPAKSAFQLHGVDAEGRPALRRQIGRSRMLEVFQRLPSCLIGIKACASAQDAGRMTGRARWPGSGIQVRA
jgi:transposase